MSVCILILNVDFLRGESQPKQSLCGLYSSKMSWNSLLTSVWLRVAQHYKNYKFVTWHAIDWPSWHFTFCTHQAKLGPPAFVLLLDFDRFWGDVSHYQKLHGSNGPKGPFCKICPLIHVSYSISELRFSQNIRRCISFQCLSIKNCTAWAKREIKIGKDFLLMIIQVVNAFSYGQSKLFK